MYAYIYIFSLFHATFIKFAIYSKVSILDSIWCNNSCCPYQELIQSYTIHSNRKKLSSFQFIYYIPANKNVTKRKIMITSIWPKASFT